MLLDAQNLFSDNQEIQAASVVSTNTVKFGKGDYSFVPLLIQVTEDFATLTSLTVKIQTSTDETFSTSKDLAQSTMALADLTTGATFPIDFIPKGNQGYIRLVYVTEGSTATKGKITAGVVAGLDRGL